MTRALTSIVGVLLLASACGGGGDGGPLADAEDAMAELEAGRVSLQLSATAGTDQPTGEVGFRMEGPFSFASDGDLPVLDLEYVQLLGGDDEAVTRVVSTGRAVYVVVDGKVTEVPPERAGALRLGDGGEGFADLGIGGWVEDAEVEERADGASVVRGRADVADLLSDLARIGAQVGGGEGPGNLDREAARRLDGLARSSEVVVELAEDDLPRNLRAVVDFGGRVPDELRQALGRYASARIQLTLSLERITEPLSVEAPVR